MKHLIVWLACLLFCDFLISAEIIDSDPISPKAEQIEELWQKANQWVENNQGIKNRTQEFEAIEDPYFQMAIRLVFGIKNLGDSPQNWNIDHVDLTHLFNEFALQHELNLGDEKSVEYGSAGSISIKFSKQEDTKYFGYILPFLELATNNKIYELNLSQYDSVYLEQIPQEIGYLTNLNFLIVNGQSRLTSLPNEFFKLNLLVSIEDSGVPWDQATRKKLFRGFAQVICYFLQQVEIDTSQSNLKIFFDALQEGMLITKEMLENFRISLDFEKIKLMQLLVAQETILLKGQDDPEFSRFYFCSSLESQVF